MRGLRRLVSRSGETRTQVSAVSQKPQKRRFQKIWGGAGGVRTAKLFFEKNIISVILLCKNVS